MSLWIPKLLHCALSSANLLIHTKNANIWHEIFIEDMMTTIFTLNFESLE